MRMPSSATRLSEVNRRVALFESDMKVRGFLSYLLPLAEKEITYSEIRSLVLLLRKIIAFYLLSNYKLAKSLHCT